MVLEPTDFRYCDHPAPVKGIVYIGAADKKLYALDAITGRQRWELVAKGCLRCRLHRRVSHRGLTGI
jgi:outer membrane protein assembly factor BamB